MNWAKVFGMGVLAAALAGLGCDKKAEPSKAEAGKGGDKKGGGKEDDGHAHGKGPNGGVIFDLGKYHAEFTVDHPKKECTVLFVSGDNKDAKPLPVAATEFTVTTNETKTKEGKVVPPMTITLKPADAKDGKAAKFVGTDAGIANVADFEGSVTGLIDGKPSKGEFKE
jgi:hypothetical protein